MTAVFTDEVWMNEQISHDSQNQERVLLDSCCTAPLVPKSMLTKACKVFPLKQPTRFSTAKGRLECRQGAQVPLEVQGGLIHLQAVVTEQQVPLLVPGSLVTNWAGLKDDGGEVVIQDKVAKVKWSGNLLQMEAQVVGGEAPDEQEVFQVQVLSEKDKEEIRLLHHGAGHPAHKRLAATLALKESQVEMAVGRCHGWMLGGKRNGEGTKGTERANGHGSVLWGQH